MRKLSVVGVAICALAGCASSPEPRTPSVRSNAVAEVLNDFLGLCPPGGFEMPPPDESPPPPPPPVVSEPEPGERDDLFIEMSLLELPTSIAVGTSLGNVSELARAAQVTLVATPHLVAHFGQPSKTELGGEALGASGVALSSLSVVPRHADADLSVLEVQLTLRSQAGAKSYSLSVSGREGEPAVARLEIAPSRSLLILFKLRAVRGQDDLRAIFQCKMQLAQRARALSRASKAR